MDGRNPSEGRVELCINGKWGTVCDDRWDLPDAIVACKQMGMPVISNHNQAFSLNREYTNPKILTAALVGTFGAGKGPIMLDELRCKGNESSLLNCPNLGINTHDCTHTEDAGVICITSESQQQGTLARQYSLHAWYCVIILSYQTIECMNSTLRVRNVPGVNNGDGRYLDVCINGIWSAICISNWNSVDATVACRQLGREITASMTTK